MPKPYDVSVKVMVEQHLPDWLALVPRKPRGPVRVIDSDLATVTAEADKVLLVEDPQPWILHLELQSKRDASLEWRVPWYNGILEYKHKCLVHSLVVLLTKNAETPGLTGEWIRQFDGEPPYRYLHYQVIRVWELHAKNLAEGGWGMFPLAPLCDDAPPILNGLVERMGDRLAAEYPDVAAARTMGTVMEILLGLRYDREMTKLMMGKVMSKLDLSESHGYQLILEEGAIKALRASILRQGKKKFGEPSADILRELGDITDESRLTELSDRVLDVGSWKDLMASRR